MFPATCKKLCAGWGEQSKEASMSTGGLVCLSSVALENNFSRRKRSAQVRAKLVTKTSLRLGVRYKGFLKGGK